jgi:hypothetical protein
VEIFFKKGPAKFDKVLRLEEEVHVSSEVVLVESAYDLIQNADLLGQTSKLFFVVL